MREIKFRAWFPKAKRLLHFDEVVIDDEYDRLAIRLVDSDAVQRYGHLAGESYLPNEPFELMQYTGLKDKNGKEICEGDIVRLGGWWDACGSAGYEKPEVLVEWDNENCGFNPFANYDSDCGVRHFANECEVIGNIYENPELLGNGK